MKKIFNSKIKMLLLILAILLIVAVVFAIRLQNELKQSNDKISELNEQITTNQQKLATSETENEKPQRFKFDVDT